MQKPRRWSYMLLAGWLALFAAPAWGQDKVASTPEARAVAYLAVEVPKWQRENKCFSCHNNGDAARALMLARDHGLLDDRAPLEETLAFLRKPETWDANGPDGPFKDEKLARIQFAAALAEADETGVIDDLPAVRAAARLVAAFQKPDGSWPSDAPGTIGSPVTYGEPLATAMALRTLLAANDRKFVQTIRRGEAWFEAREPKSVLDAAATMIALSNLPSPAAMERYKESLELIAKSQSPDGGWGPFVTSPPEVFDTAIVLIALAPWKNKLQPHIATAGRKYLIATQLPDGSWPPTTRPPGADSYAQQLSTTGWALQALLVTK